MKDKNNFNIHILNFYKNCKMSKWGQIEPILLLSKLTTLFLWTVKLAQFNKVDNPWLMRKSINLTIGQKIFLPKANNVNIDFDSVSCGGDHTHWKSSDIKCWSLQEQNSTEIRIHIFLLCLMYVRQLLHYAYADWATSLIH